MCGIAGGINTESINFELIKDALYHRGPDAQNIYKNRNVTLLQTRLSIIDTANGHQPMQRGRYTITFNGEIYNYKELKADIAEFTLETNSDTEVLLYLYIKYGRSLFEKIDGMFAFAIFDEKKNCLLLARDRAGKKPLYFSLRNRTFLFASELNSFKQIAPEIDEEAIAAFLRCGFFYRETTPYKDIEELEAGTFLEIDCNTLAINKKRYFNILDYYKQEKIESYEESIKLVESALEKSVEDRLLSSDLEVGAFLSGGIDSSLVVAMASKFRENLKTFTVRFDGAYDESPLAKLVAQRYGTKHTELSISMNLRDDIEQILTNYGEPFFDSSAIPSYYVSRESKKHLTVILNGDGADELFGGYRRYVPIANDLIKYARLLSPLANIAPKPKEKKSLYNYLYRLLTMSAKSGLDFYLSATTDIFEDFYRFEENSILQKMDSEIKETMSLGIDGLDKMLYLDFSLILFSDLLVKMDIATMANSLEGRSPFLSKYFLELAPRIQSRDKVRGKETKYILRDLAKKYLPTELLNQPKRGFEVPLKQWVENDLKENIFDSLNRECYSQQFIKKEQIEKLLENRVAVSPEKRAKMLWNLYCLEVWYKNRGA